MPEKNTSLGRAEPSGSPTAFVWRLWSPNQAGSLGTDTSMLHKRSFYSHLSAVAKEQGPGLCVVRFSNKYRNIYSSYLEKQTSGSSAKSNTQRDGCSLSVYVQWGSPQALHSIPWISLLCPFEPGWVCGWVLWVAAALFSIFLLSCRNVKKVVTKVWNFLSSIIVFFFFLCFLL